MKEIQRKYNGKFRKYKGNRKEIQRKHEGNKTEI